MISVIISVLLYIPLCLLVAAFVSKGEERIVLFRRILLAWLVLVPVVMFVDSYFPFTEKGDDDAYYEMASAAVYSFPELVSFKRFIGVLEQPGYPWLLSIIKQFSGHELLAYKMHNLFFLILLSLVWYRIAVALVSDEFGRKVFVSILMLTPLWYYVFFLLKDMAIALLQGVFLLGLVQLWLHKDHRNWLLVVLGTFPLLLFRSLLVLQNAFVLGFTVLAMFIFSRKDRDMMISVFVAFVFLLMLFQFSGNPDMMAVIGIGDKSRVIGSIEMRDAILSQSDVNQVQRLLYPVVYLFSETSGLNPKHWVTYDTSWLRGVLAIPWILFIVPYFIIGIVWLFRKKTSFPDGHVSGCKMIGASAVGTPWSILLFFVLSMIIVAWQFGDTTRWRIADMPAIVTIASFGWCCVSPQRRYKVLFIWIMITFIVSSGYYIFHA